MGNCGAKETSATTSRSAPSNGGTKPTAKKAAPKNSPVKKTPTASAYGETKPSTKKALAKKEVVQKKSSGININENLIRETNKDFHEVYEVVERVGEGSISNISKVRKKQSAAGNKDVMYALKEIDTELVKPEFLEEMYNEIQLMKTLDHPNIIKAYETYDVPPKILAIVLELCTGGDLNSRGPYTEAETAKIVGKLVGAINYLHRKKITHRDIKFENIMFESKKPDAEIKLIDFGLSTRYTGGAQLTDRVGTIYTMSPQVMQGEYTQIADMWSIGVVTFQLLAGEPPFWANTKKEIIKKVKKAEYNFDAPAWKFVSKEAKNFVSHLMEVDPTKRWNAQKAINSPWLKKHAETVHTKTDAAFVGNLRNSLAEYQESGDLKKLALHVIARKSTTDQIFQLRAAFDEIDANDDGTITYKEFMAALTSLGFEKADIDTMFRNVDVDGSGSVQYTEFLAATLEAHGRIEEQRVAEAFDQLDDDGSGFITKDELRQILGDESDEAYVDKLMKEADINGDGKISYDEFLQAFHGKTSSEMQKMQEM